MPSPSLGAGAVPGDVPEIGATLPRHSYGEILKSTALIGGSSFITIASGIVRTKVMALLLGPSGVGLFGLYSSVADLVQSLAGLGIQSSGVRQIAEAVGSREPERIARTATVLRRVSLVLGLIGAALLVAFARPISALTFGGEEGVLGMMLLSAAVFFRLIANGQGALLQGLRRISDVARMNVYGAIAATGATIPLVFFLREDGVVPSLVAVAAFSLGASWWYSRKTGIPTVAMTAAEIWRESSALLKLGGAFMTSALLTMGAAYAIRIIVLRVEGFEAAGLYQAAWALGGLYVGFILQAMGADFYPRLTAVAADRAACNRIVNEQARVGLLIAGPGVIATLTFAPFIVALFYSSEFAGATGLLRWICLGMILRVVSFPMGYIVLARGAQQIFFWTEIIATVVHVGLAYLLVARLGVDGAGAAFFGLYAWHAVFIYAIVRRMTGFAWSPANRTLLLTYLPLTGTVFAVSLWLSPWASATIGGLATVGTAIHATRSLIALLSPGAMPAPAAALLRRVGL